MLERVGSQSADASLADLRGIPTAIEDTLTTANTQIISHASDQLNQVTHR
jgi:hypothetical protein